MEWINKWQPEEGRFVFRGIEGDNPEDPIQDYLNWCGCGDPEEAQTALRQALRHVQNMKELLWEHIITFEEWDKQGQELLGQWKYFIYYVLDEKGLTEHGGSVPGWLTPEGLELLEYLEFFDKAKL